MHARKSQITEIPSPPAPRRWTIKRIIKWFVSLVIIAIFAAGSWLGWKFYNYASKLTGNKNPLQIFSLLRPTAPRETNGRVNVLLAGYSVDDPGHQGSSLTDSIMVISVDPAAKRAVLLSIPRDLLVDIPGFGYQKINAAYEDGQQENFSQAGYDSGGMGLLEDVIQQNFGIQTDYYGLLDYTAFRDAVNAVGGVTLTIKSSDPRGLYDPYTNLKLPNGSVTLNGQQALNLARARGDGPGAYGFPGGDFDRTAHQQQLLLALKNKAGGANVILSPLKVAGLADAVGNNVTTDMSLGVMESLYEDGKGMSNSQIQSVTLNNLNGQDLLTGYTTRDGQDALVPAAGFDDYSQIQAAVQNLLTAPSNSSKN